MAEKKKAPRKGAALQKFKEDLSAGTIGAAYVFYGEESYLREYYLGELRKKLVPPGFETFNYHALEGKDLTAQILTETATVTSFSTEAAFAPGYTACTHTIGTLMSGRRLTSILTVDHTPNPSTKAEMSTTATDCLIIKEKKFFIALKITGGIKPPLK